MSRWLLENMGAGACQWVIVTESGLDWAKRKMKGRGTPSPEVGMPSPSKSLDRGSQVLTGTASGPDSDLGAYNITAGNKNPDSSAILDLVKNGIMCQ